MTDFANSFGTLAFVGYALLQVSFVLRALLRPHREPASRVAWVLLMVAIPTIGMLLYFLFGETNLGARRARLYREADRELPRPKGEIDVAVDSLIDPQYRHLFRVGHSISGLAPAGGNSAQLMPDADAMIDALVADMDAATGHIHLLFYIWLTDRNGTKVIEAAKRAARRGVKVRALADDLGSRALIKSQQWQDMIEAGVDARRALPIRNIMLHPFTGRIDLRNHRKVVVIDGRITYCGSQNCADAEFLPKREFGPWVDLVVRFEGPVAQQSQWLFGQDWLAHSGESLGALIRQDAGAVTGSSTVAQVMGSGPTTKSWAMPEMFEVLIHAARSELVITTPYFVPTDAIQSALRSAVHRGVETILVLPARNDSRIVSAASRTYYQDLLSVGVRIFEYPLGLLHAKTLTFDGRISLIGSANLDRRSFDLNFENAMLLQDADLANRIRQRQAEYISVSREVMIDQMLNEGIPRRLWRNTVAMFGPIL